MGKSYVRTERRNMFRRRYVSGGGGSNSFSFFNCQHLFDFVAAGTVLGFFMFQLFTFMVSIDETQVHECGEHQEDATKHRRDNLRLRRRNVICLQKVRHIKVRNVSKTFLSPAHEGCESKSQPSINFNELFFSFARSRYHIKNSYYRHHC